MGPIGSKVHFQGDIRELWILSNLVKGGGDVGFEVIPLKAEFLRGAHLECVLGLAVTVIMY